MAWTLRRIFLIVFILECSNFTGIVASFPPEESGTLLCRPQQENRSHYIANMHGNPFGRRPVAEILSYPENLAEILSHQEIRTLHQYYSLIKTEGENPRISEGEREFMRENGRNEDDKPEQNNSVAALTQRDLPDPPPMMEGRRIFSVPSTTAPNFNRFPSQIPDFADMIPDSWGHLESATAWTPPQAPSRRQLIPEPLRRSKSGRSQAAQFVGRGNRLISAEEKYEEMLQEYLEDPPSLLPTAVVTAVGGNKNKVKARILLDTGAQGCTISDELVRKLGLTRREVESAESAHMGVGGIDRSTHKTSLNLCSRFSNFCLTIKAPIKERPIIVNALLDSKAVPRHSNLQLAEEGMPESMKIDVLVGVDYFEQIFLREAVHIENFPTFYNTKFGAMTFGKGKSGFKYMVLSEQNERQLAQTRADLGLSW